jgi:hypothetical protein
MMTKSKEKRGMWPPPVATCRESDVKSVTHLKKNSIPMACDRQDDLFSVFHADGHEACCCSAALAVISRFQHFEQVFLLFMSSVFAIGAAKMGRRLGRRRHY